MRSLTTVSAALVTLALGLASVGPAMATTVGGNSSSDVGAFVLAGGRIVYPTFDTDDPGEYIDQPPTAESGLSTLGAAHGSSRNVALEQLTSAGLSEAVLASAGHEVAVAWIGGSGLRSGLLDATGRHVIAQSATGTPLKDVAIAVAVADSGARAIAWPDEDGEHVQAIDPAGVVQSTVLAPAATVGAPMTLTADGTGGWWILWSAPSQLYAAHDVGGAIGATHAISTAVLDRRPGLGPDSPDITQPWRAVADGRGGVYAELTHGVVRATDAGMSTVVSSASPLALAAGEGTTAIAERSGAGVAVRRLGVRLGAPIRLPRAGTLLDVALDHATGTVDVLTESAAAHVRLTRITRTGRVGATRDVALCRHRPSAQVLAANGLVAVSCAGRDSDRESVETGGDDLDGHGVVHVLLRGSRVLGSDHPFAGQYSY
jgi:hypothetical protein